MSLNANDLPTPLKQAAEKANAEYWRLNKEQDKRCDEARAKGEPLPTWEGTGPLYEMVARAVYAHLRKAAPAFDEHAAQAFAESSEGVADSTGAVNTWELVALIDGARWQHQQMAAQVAALRASEKYHKQRADGNHESYLVAQAEIERLRAEVADARQVIAIMERGRFAP